MSHRNLTRREKAVEVSALSAQLWLAADERCEGFEDAIALAADELDSLLAYADDWDAAVSAQRDWDTAASAAAAEDAAEDGWAEPGLVDVASHTRPGLVHTVDVRAGRCTCEAFTFRGRCRHVAEARAAA